jgi:hypothetical protein
MSEAEALVKADMMPYEAEANVKMLKQILAKRKGEAVDRMPVASTGRSD